MEAKQEEKKHTVVLGPGSMALAEFWRNEWVANAPENCTPDDIKYPEFWSLMSAQMKPYDRVEVRGYDGTWMAEVLVIRAERTFATVKVLNVYELTDIKGQGKSDDKFSLKFRGPRKWSIIRNSDETVIREDIDTQDEAQRIKSEYETTASVR